MRLALILISLVSLTSCSRRVVDLQASKEKIRIDQKIDSAKLVQVKSKTAIYSLSFSDSEADYSIEIIPGDQPINYSPEKGFTGNAKSLNIKGKSKKSDKATNITVADLDSTAVENTASRLQVQAEQSEEKRNSERSGPGIVTIILCVAGALIGIWLLSQIKIF